MSMDSLMESLSNRGLMQSVLSRHYGAGTEHQIDRLDAFCGNIARNIRRRLDGPDSSSDRKGLTMFILEPDPDLNNVAHIDRPTFDDGLDDISGYIWLVNERARRGRGIAHTVDSNKDLFQMVQDERLLGDRVAVLWNPSDPRQVLRLYPAGVNDPDEVKEIDLSLRNIEPHQVKEALDSLYTAKLVTPDAVNQWPVWTNAEDHAPATNAEANIGHLVVSALAGRFYLHRFRLRAEQSSPVGRLDILLEEVRGHPEHVIIRHAVLELKILRGFSYTGKTKKSLGFNQNWAAKGLEQARDYRDETNARWSALCCFDMQVTDHGEQCLSPLSIRATEWGVHVWRWFLYSSSEELRSAISVELSAGGS